MKARDLPRAVQPKPVEPPVCAACKVFRPDCIVPYGDGAVECCWLCAHAIVEHDCPLEKAVTHECECLPTEIYPRSHFGTEAEFEQRRDDIIARRALA